jgi:hypothetical protein
MQGDRGGGTGADIGMDGDIAALVVGFLASTVGFSLFLYGRKQARPPQLAGGLLLMVLPFAVAGACGVTIAAVAVLAAVVAAVRAGW